MSDTVQRAEVGDAPAELAAFLANPGLFPDPYPLFRRIRDVEPVHWSEVGTWVVLGHPEAREVFKDQTFSRRASAEDVVRRFTIDDANDQEAIDTHLAQFVHMDDPDHARVRSLVAHAFTPKAIRTWESLIVKAVDDLVDELEGRDEFDVLHDFGKLLPSRVICQMLSLPHEDHALFEDWTNGWLSTNVSDPRADVSAAVAPLRAFHDYLNDLVSERRRSTDRGDNLVNLLIDAEEDGHRLSQREVIASLMLLIIGGHETTANLIANGSLALLRNRDQLQLLRDQPDLQVSAVEEFLRYDGTARSQPRLALTDVSIGDVTIREGDRVQVIVGAGNRDPRVYDRPDELDVTRVNNGHLGFGAGAHFCLGVHVARLESRHAIDAIARRVGDLELNGDIVWRNAHVRALTALPVRRA
ncbi:MAG: cytochrome [Actinomycetia bacterium]|nr:cytochrome [Actinomycetes bacterium]